MPAKRFLLVAALMGLCAPASAAAPQEEGGWYGGLNVRGEQRFGMGYRFGPRFSVEGTYGGLDSQRYEAPAAPWAQKIEPWPSYGMSARYEFSKRLFGRFEWDRYSPANELDAFRRGDERYQFRFGFRF